jgi:hypothetical protein
MFNALANPQFVINTGQTSGQDGAQQTSRLAGADGISPDLISWAQSQGYSPTQNQAFSGVDNPYDTSSMGSWQDFLNSKGWKLGQQAAPGQNQATQQLFDQSGNPVSDQFAANLQQDDGSFAGAMALMGLYGGAAGAGLLSSAPTAASSAPSAFEGIDMGGGAAGAPATGGGMAGTDLPGYAAYTGAGSAPGYAAGPGGLSTDAGASGLTADQTAYGALENANAAAGGAGGAGSSTLGDIGSFLKSNPGLTNVGGGLINSLIGLYSTNKATGALQNATNQANAMWAPYAAFGAKNLNTAQGLLDNPSSITSDPGYQFNLNQGQTALDRSAASKGGLYSGAQMKASQQYGQNYANNQFNSILGRYTGAAQLGATGTTNISNNLTGLGSAVGSADLSTGTNVENQVNNALGNFNYGNSPYAQFNNSLYGTRKTIGG